MQISPWLSGDLLREIMQVDLQLMRSLSPEMDTHFFGNYLIYGGVTPPRLTH